MANGVESEVFEDGRQKYSEERWCCVIFIVLASARISLKYSLARARSNPQGIVLN